MSDRDLFVLIFTGVFCLLGIVFAAIGFGMRQSRERKRLRCSRTATGRVTEHIRRHRTHTGSGRSSAPSWHAVYEFTADGELQRKESVMGYPSPRPALEEQVTVCYNPHKPLDCYIEEETGMFQLLYRVFLSVGVLLFVVGAVVGLVVSAVWQ